MRRSFTILLVLFSSAFFCQDILVDKEKAILIAGKHRFYSRRVIAEHVSSTSKVAILDTANKMWIVTFSKLSFRSWGRANKLGDPEYRRPCRKTNNCYAIREKITQVDAITGKILKKSRLKKIAGCYE